MIVSCLVVGVIFLWVVVCFEFFRKESVRGGYLGLGRVMFEF